MSITFISVRSVAKIVYGICELTGTTLKLYYIYYVDDLYLTNNNLTAFQSRLI